MTRGKIVATPPDSIKFVARRISVFLWISLLTSASLVFTVSSRAAEPRPKNVLVLFTTFHRGRNVWLDDIESTARARVRGPVNFYSAYLEYSRIDDPAYQISEAEDLRRQFQDVRLDLIIAVDNQALRLVLKHRQKSFPDIPIVFTAVDPEFGLSEGEKWPGVTGYSPSYGVRQTVQLALRLHPDTNTVAIISEDRGVWWAATHSELLRHQDKVREIDIIGPPDGQMIEKVAALPPHTVILYHIVMSEYAQPAIGVYDAAEMIARRVPTYSVFQNLVLGHGGVGGAYKNYIKEALVTGDMVGRVLSGERPEDIPIVRDYDAYVTVDWRALQRWHIPESALPQGSVVLYQEPTLWEQNRNYILAGLGVIAVQAILIVGLFWERARRRKAEIERRKSEEKFAMAFRESPLAITIAKISDGSYVEVNETFEVLTGWQRNEVIGRSPLEMDVWVNPDQRSTLLRDLREKGNIRELEVAFRRKDGQIRTALGSAELIEVNGEQCALSVIADITERKQAEEAMSGFSRRLIEAQETERTRIARELHDDINQRLAIVAVSLKTLKQYLPDSAMKANRGIDETCEKVAELESDVQALSHQLHSSKLEYLGLEAAASGFCRELSERQNVKINLHCEGIPEELSSDVALCLFRVLQEALHNALKYSGVNEFKVSITGVSNAIELRVHDSGAGFDARQTSNGLGLGLTSMKERVRLVGGECSITSELGEGTIVLARVPLIDKTATAGAAA